MTRGLVIPSFELSEATKPIKKSIPLSIGQFHSLGHRKIAREIKKIEITQIPNINSSAKVNNISTETNTTKNNAINVSGNNNIKSANNIVQTKKFQTKKAKGYIFTNNQTSVKDSRSKKPLNGTNVFENLNHNEDSQSYKLKQKIALDLRNKFLELKLKSATTSTILSENEHNENASKTFDFFNGTLSKESTKINLLSKQSSILSSSSTINSISCTSNGRKRPSTPYHQLKLNYSEPTSESEGTMEEYDENSYGSDSARSKSPPINEASNENNQNHFDEDNEPSNFSMPYSKANFGGTTYNNHCQMHFDKKYKNNGAGNQLLEKEFSITAWRDSDEEEFDISNLGGATYQYINAVEQPTINARTSSPFSTSTTKKSTNDVGEEKNFLNLNKKKISLFNMMNKGEKDIENLKKQEFELIETENTKKLQLQREHITPQKCVIDFNSPYFLKLFGGAELVENTGAKVLTPEQKLLSEKNAADLKSQKDLKQLQISQEQAVRAYNEKKKKMEKDLKTANIHNKINVTNNSSHLADVSFDCTTNRIKIRPKTTCATLDSIKQMKIEGEKPFLEKLTKKDKLIRPKTSLPTTRQQEEFISIKHTNDSIRFSMIELKQIEKFEKVVNREKKINLQPFSGATSDSVTSMNFNRSKSASIIDRRKVIGLPSVV
ncbi:hypothetical protein HK099_005720 [Clydaea vesicula]|uniref:Uncharacterized protein n=1 Tax=Clydaea vesicula TaxID=447962 RepID=A0AAD5UA86_9FUNG|nr:hypothetical protein HK099_005720 [Clydaea vesicula]